MGGSVHQRIRQLESVARRLDPDGPARRAARDPIVAYAERFLDGLGDAAAYDADRAAARGLRDAPIGEHGADPGELVELLRRCVDGPGLNPASGGHLAYIPGGGLYASALGDFLAAVTNRYAGVRFTGPGAVEMEEMLVEWMAGVVGYPRGCGGTLTSGGSIANLIAVVTARQARGVRARDVERAVVYHTGQVHHCVEKALRIAGMGDCVRRTVAVDEAWRMVPAALQDAVAADRAAGLEPWLVVASAGTTDTGAIDPLPAIAAVARDAGAWFHVDAAYGGFFALVPERRAALAGMAEADSIVLDPHKGLFLPYGTGAVLIRDRDAMRQAHACGASYMQDAVDDAPSPADLSPELSRHFRGLRLWLPLRLHGVAPFRACLEEKLLLARHFHREVARLGFETGAQPELSVVTYRWAPAGADAGACDAANRAILAHVHRDGRVFLSSTTLEGRFTLRLAALAFRTHLDTIETALAVLGQAAARVSAGGASVTR
jgi:glutamate/tyrosine decarboxylase-like PLP-dependent enzyme